MLMKYVAILRKHGEGDVEFIESEDLHKISVIVLSWGYTVLTPDYEIEITAVETAVDKDGYEEDDEENMGD